MPRTHQPLDPARARRRELEKDKHHAISVEAWGAELLALLPGEYGAAAPSPSRALSRKGRVRLYRRRAGAREALFNAADTIQPDARGREGLPASATD